MCAWKLKQGDCGNWRLELGLVNHGKLHSSPSGNDKRDISSTHHEFLLLRGLSQAALGLQEVVVHSSGQWAGSSQLWAGMGMCCPKTFCFPVSLCDQLQEVRCLDAFIFSQLILLNGLCRQGSPHSAFLAMPIIVPPWWELALHLNTCWAWPSFPQKSEFFVSFE